MLHLFSSQGLHSIQRLATLPSALVFDFDGTLAPIVKQPEDAKVPTQIATNLKVLSQSWPVAVVTGRSVADVRNKLGFTPDYLFGNHGAERADDPGAESFSKKLDPCRQFLMAHASVLAPRKVCVEDKGLSLALHYRQSDKPDATRVWLHELMRPVSEGVMLADGHMVINIVMLHAPDKGDALQTILQESGCGNALVMGDDENDEAAFAKAPEHAVTVRIGSAAVLSHAHFRLSGHHQVNGLLTLMLNQRN